MQNSEPAFEISIPCSQTGCNVLHRSVCEYVLIVEGGKVSVVVIDQVTGLFGTPAEINNDMSVKIDHAMWGVPKRATTPTILCCWRVGGARVRVDVCEVFAVDSVLTSRIVCTINCDPVGQHGMVWLDGAPVVALVVIEDRRVTVYKILDNSRLEQQDLLIERNPTAKVFRGGIWESKKNTLLVYSDEDLILLQLEFDQTIKCNQRIFPVKPLVVNKIWTCVFIKNTLNVVIAAAPLTVGSPVPLEDDVYVEVESLGAGNDNVTLVLLSLDSKDGPKLLSRLDLGQKFEPDILHYTPHTGSIVASGNKADLVAVLAVDTRYQLVIVDELRFSGYTVKGLTNMTTTKPRQGMTGLRGPAMSTTKNLRSSKASGSGAAGTTPEAGEETHRLLVSLGRQLSALPRPGFAMYELTFWYVDWKVSISLAQNHIQFSKRDGDSRILINPSVLDAAAALALEKSREDSALAVQKSTRSQSTLARASSAVSGKINKAAMQAARKERDRSVKFPQPAASSCSLTCPMEQDESNEDDLLDEENSVSRYVDLLFVPLSRAHELTELVGNQLLSSDQLLDRVDAHCLTLASRQMAPIYRLERFTLDRQCSISYRLLLSVFQIVDVAIFHYEVDSLLIAWVPPTPNGRLSAKLRPTGYYFVTGHPTNACTHSFASHT